MTGVQTCALPIWLLGNRPQEPREEMEGERRELKYKNVKTLKLEIMTPEIKVLSRSQTTLSRLEISELVTGL